MKSRYFILAIVILFFSCRENERPMGEEEVFWVYSYLIPCSAPPIVPSPCLGITASDQFDFNWAEVEIIPYDIEGFTFKPTYLQRLLVLNQENPTTGEIKRKLIKVLEEKKDFIELLEGSWTLKKHLGRDFPNIDFPNGHSISINAPQRILSTTDGCNQMRIELKEVAQSKILSFGMLTSTAMACPPRLQINPFSILEENFKREGNVLTFYSETEGEIAVWEKLN